MNRFEPSAAVSLNVPRPVSGYLTAEKAKDTEMLVRYFADDAVVHDEAHEHRGHDAIRAWKREADAKYQYVLEPLHASVNGPSVKVRAKLTGDFPGSPIELDFLFNVANDKITSLKIG